MNTLKMTAYQVDGNLYKSQYKSENDVPEDEMCHNSWWYLHGELQDIVGFDKAITTNCKTAGYSKETINWTSIEGSEVKSVRKNKPLIHPVMHINAIIPVEVEGIYKPCIGYFWTGGERLVSWKGKQYLVWQQRGLVCLKDDEKACEYALEK